MTAGAAAIVLVALGAGRRGRVPAAEAAGTLSAERGAALSAVDHGPGAAASTLAYGLHADIAGEGALVAGGTSSPAGVGQVSGLAGDLVGVAASAASPALLAHAVTGHAVLLRVAIDRAYATSGIGAPLGSGPIRNPREITSVLALAV